MSAITDPPRETFRLGMLLSDTRYRSITIQIIALMLTILAFAWLIDNVVKNLEALGKDFNFSFLFNSAGYDVNQRLLEYESQDPHGRAAILGFLNTFVVAILGCITATFLGVFAGVLRLSNNWIVAKIMTVYVEAFRNIPVLIWILIVVAVVNESLPAPRDFRGENATASLMVWDSVAITNRGFYIPAPFFSRGFGDIDVAGYFKISIDLLFLVALLAAGIFTSWAIKRWADDIQNSTGIRPSTWWKRIAVIVVPFVIALWIMGFFLQSPELKGFNFKGGIHMRDSLIGLWLALSLYTGAFIAEIVRAGILSVSTGQHEASAALGLRPNKTMNLVILPQALRVIIPPLISNYLNLTKNSSLAIAVGYMDATGTLGGITLNQTGREMECLLLLMAFYLVVSLSISAVMNWYNESVKLKER